MTTHALPVHHHHHYLKFDGSLSDSRSYAWLFVLGSGAFVLQAFAAILYVRGPSWYSNAREDMESKVLIHFEVRGVSERGFRNHTLWLLVPHREPEGDSRTRQDLGPLVRKPLSELFVLV